MSATPSTQPGLPRRHAALESLARERYIVSPLFDGLFFIGSPLLAIAVILGAWQFMPALTIESAVLVYMAVGHHVPTFLRAYGDPDEFAENKFRLLVIPAFVVPLMVAIYLVDSRLIGLLFVWDQYHFVRQHYGFMRIYDAKNKSITTRRMNLDQWLCFSLFVAIITHSEFYAFVYTSSFFDLGLVFPEWTGTLLRQGSLAVAIGVCVAYALDLGRRLASGEPVSLLKLGITVTTYGTWWFAYVALSHPALSYPISSFFHCLQYDALAWHYSEVKARGLARRKGNAIFRFMHQSRRPWFYLLAIGGYGFLSEIGSTLVPGAVFIVNRTTGVLHYYFDSFIWRVRRTAFRQNL